MSLSLEALKTYTTRYRGEDGRERAVMLHEHYDLLISWVVECRKHRGPWEAYIEEGCCNIPIGRKGSDDAPILVYGKDLEDPKAFAVNLAKLLNESEGR